MALGCPAADRAGRAALQAAVEAGNPLPFLRGGQMGGGAPGPGTAPPAGPPYRTVCLVPQDERRD